MALDDFDLAQLLKRMGIFGDSAQAPQVPAWMTSPHQTVTAQAEPSGGIPQAGGAPWYMATPHEPFGPAAGAQAEPGNDELASLLAEPWDESAGGIQGPQMSDIQIHQTPRHIQMPPLEVSGHRPEHDDPEIRKRKAALASIGGM
jgi:hypothetical protein